MTYKVKCQQQKAEERQYIQYYFFRYVHKQSATVCEITLISQETIWLRGRARI